MQFALASSLALRICFSRYMWTVVEYIVDHPDGHDASVSCPDDHTTEDALLEDRLKEIKDYVGKYAENYLISFHYIDVPIVICCGSRLEGNNRFKIIREEIKYEKVVTRILMLGQADYVQGFHFIRKDISIRKHILSSPDLQEFNTRAAHSGYESYIINDLRTVWTNSRYEYLSSALAQHNEQLCLPNKEHPLYRTFVDFLKQTYRRGIDRFKTFICIGSTHIGKSVFFTQFIVPERYYIYHSNNLEYSRMSAQPRKIFRILDDINWENVNETQLKALMNRNISSVDIKYGYEYIFPLIPIIVMNKEEYQIFRSHFSTCWQFIERNAIVYPPQKGNECIEEDQYLFTSERAEKDHSYLFDEVMAVKSLELCTGENMNEYIKSQLDATEGYFYDNNRYMLLPMSMPSHIPNPEMSKKAILKQYEEYVLRKKKKEIENEGEKPPRTPWFRSYKKKISRSRDEKSDDLESVSQQDVFELGDETEKSDEDDRMDESESGDDEENDSFSYSGNYGDTIEL